jgi:hypothetical protein
MRHVWLKSDESIEFCAVVLNIVRAVPFQVQTKFGIQQYRIGMIAKHDQDSRFPWLLNERSQNEQLGRLSHRASELLGGAKVRRLHCSTI